MPIYEYECNECGEHFERLFFSPDEIPSDVACPECQSTEVQRIISAPTVHTSGDSEHEGEEGEDTSTEQPQRGRQGPGGIVTG